MTPEKYGPEYSSHLLEQYKLYVELTDKVSERRLKTNQFYTSLLSGILALLGVLVERDFLAMEEGYIAVAFGGLGVLLTWVWRVNIRSYRQLNSGRFKVIHDMEQLLPFACFDVEWKYLGGGVEKKKYFQLSRVELLVPAILSIPYLFLVVYGLYRLF